MQVQQIPEGDDWWIVRALLGALGTVIGTVVMLAKFIQGMYQGRINELNERVGENEKQISELRVETSKCQQDRAELHGECVMLRQDCVIMRKRLDEIERK